MLQSGIKHKQTNMRNTFLKCVCFVEVEHRDQHVCLACSHADSQFASRPCYTKDHHKNGTNCLCLARRHKDRSLTVLSDCLKGWAVCGTVYGDMHFKRSPLNNHNSRMLYRGPRFLSSVTWHSMQNMAVGTGGQEGKLPPPPQYFANPQKL